MTELKQTSRHAVLDLVQLIADLNLSARHYRSYQKYLMKQISLIEDGGKSGQELYLSLSNTKMEKKVNFSEKSEAQYDALYSLIQKNNQLEIVRKEVLELRRNYMSELGNGFKVDPKMWCSCKHMFDAFTLAEEVTNALGNEDNLLLASYEEKTFRLMLKTLSLYLGYEPMDCESCLTDQILRDDVIINKSNDELNAAVKPVEDFDVKSGEASDTSRVRHGYHNPINGRFDGYTIGNLTSNKNNNPYSDKNRF